MGIQRMSVDKRPRRRGPGEHDKDRLLIEPMWPSQPLHGTGIMVLNTSLRLLHRNPRAWQLCRSIHLGGEPAAYGVLPPVILELCASVKHHGSFEQISATGRRPIVLSGFKIPGVAGQPGRLLILLREAREDDLPSLHHAVQLFGLTQREESVMRQLARGYTNKEIANVLCIAEQTVKEHMKHLMIKTGACTRTGLLARMLAAVSGAREGSVSQSMAG